MSTCWGRQAGPGDPGLDLARRTVLRTRDAFADYSGGLRKVDRGEIALHRAKSYSGAPKRLHVVERFRLSGDGNTLEVVVKVKDPDTFNEPLYMMLRWRKVPNTLREMVCAENNNDHFGMNLFPIPQADKPDF